MDYLQKKIENKQNEMIQNKMMKKIISTNKTMPPMKILRSETLDSPSYFEMIYLRGLPP